MRARAIGGVDRCLLQLGGVARRGSAQLLAFGFLLCLCAAAWRWDRRRVDPLALGGQRRNAGSDLQLLLARQLARVLQRGAHGDELAPGLSLRVRLQHDVVKHPAFLVSSHERHAPHVELLGAPVVVLGVCVARKAALSFLKRCLVRLHRVPVGLALLSDSTSCLVPQPPRLELAHALLRQAPLGGHAHRLNVDEQTLLLGRQVRDHELLVPLAFNLVQGAIAILHGALHLVVVPTKHGLLLEVQLNMQIRVRHLDLALVTNLHAEPADEEAVRVQARECDVVPLAMVQQVKRDATDERNGGGVAHELGLGPDLAIDHDATFAVLNVQPGHRRVVRDLLGVVVRLRILMLPHAREGLADHGVERLLDALRLVMPTGQVPTGDGQQTLQPVAPLGHAQQQIRVHIEVRAALEQRPRLQEEHGDQHTREVLAWAQALDDVHEQGRLHLLIAHVLATEAGFGIRNCGVSE
mmetsp:Transcript_23258/g.74892  ORF Transcript_23258/g.74892 Transcript_23258/m.74892 type:complete len:467 (+) Transcript_23258:178-1578(+)